MPVSSPRQQQQATRAVFFVPGFVLAGWAPLVPFAKVRAALDDGGLGWVLLCLGLGSLVAMPLAGALAARYGCRTVMLSAIGAMLLAFPLLALVSSASTLGLVLVVFGAAIGGLDCVMNLQAVAVERDAGRPMMSGFHAYYSIGSLAGAAAITLALGAGLGPLASTLPTVVVAVLMTLRWARAWRTERAAAHATAFALPRGIVLLIGLVCFVTFLVEGAMLDWSAVFLHDVRAIDLAHAGWAFVAFNLAMTVARLMGDRVVARLGRPLAALSGGVTGCAGLLVLTLAPDLPMVFGGFVLLGVGCANIVPLMLTLASRQTRMPESLAIPVVTTMGYAGILTGPAAIGWVAQQGSLPAAFLIVAGALAAAGAIGALLRIRS